MNTYNSDRKDEKKGFIPFLSKIFASPAKPVSGIGSIASKGAIGGAKGGFFASLFATKAGVVGLVLGTATIAAGIGVIYNYISPSYEKVYTPDLFSNVYYEEVQKQANVERAKSDTLSPSVSSIDVFKEGAKKEFGSEELNPGENQSESATPTDHISADVQNVSISNAMPEVGNSVNKLNASLGFDTKGQGGGSQSGIPRLQTSGGLWENMNSKFAPISVSAKNVNKANNGSTSKMNKGLSARVVSSPKYRVPNINRKGAFGQAKYASNASRFAASNVSDAASRTTAEQAFSGRLTGSGDVAVPIGGTGLGGAGLSQGNKLKANEPSLRVNEYTPPTPQKSYDTPWKKLVDYALYAMLASAAFILITSILANKGKALTIANPASATAYFKAAKAFCYLAIASAAIVIGIGVMLATKYGQKLIGIMYGMIGAVLIYQAFEALSGINKGMTKADKMEKLYASEEFKKLTAEQQADIKSMSSDTSYEQVVEKLNKILNKQGK